MPEEFKHLSTGDIYTVLRSYVDEPDFNISLDGFAQGIVDYTGEPRNLHIARLNEASTIYRPNFLQRGFTDEDLDRGIWLVADRPYKYHQYPQEPKAETRRVWATMSGGLTDWKMIEPTSDKAQIAVPTDSEYVNRILDVGFLSMLPYIIAQRFDSYQQFSDELRRTHPQDIDMSGIDYYTFGLPMPYNGGLGSFVKVAEGLIRGLGPMDSHDIVIAANTPGVNRFSLMGAIRTRLQSERRQDELDEGKNVRQFHNSREARIPNSFTA